MKPIDTDELRAAIGKLQLNRNAQQSAVERPLHGVLNDTRQYRERFLITKGDELCMLCADDINVFEAFRKVMPQSFVIFTTAYDEYAMEAIKNNGLDYLMKPIDTDELRAAIGKLQLNRNAQQSAVERPLHGVLNDTRQYRERFLITKGDELCMLCADDISYINIHDNRITAFAVDGTSYPLPMSMNDLEQALDPARFFRLNRQYIANINGIRKISFYFSSKLIVRLKGCEDENIVISKEKATLFKKWLEK